MGQFINIFPWPWSSTALWPGRLSATIITDCWVSHLFSFWPLSVTQVSNQDGDFRGWPKETYTWSFWPGSPDANRLLSSTGLVAVAEPSSEVMEGPSPMGRYVTRYWASEYSLIFLEINSKFVLQSPPLWYYSDWVKAWLSLRKSLLVMRSSLCSKIHSRSQVKEKINYRLI